MDLKFRAWCIRDEQYYEVTAIEWDTQLVWILDGKYRDERSFDEVIIEQYTGSEDKNGKEVYVGDIVKITFVFVEVEIISVNNLYEFAQITWDNVSTIEKIGNIHNNKELL